MFIDRCRVCNNKLEVLLEYKNMPKAAQNMPSLVETKTEKGEDLEICQCTGCSLVQLSNSPVPYYKEVIRASAVSEEMKDFRLHQFEQIIQKYSLQNKTIAEIGCGNGEYLSLLDKFDINACGIEYAKQSIDFCKNNGLSVKQMYIEDEEDIISETPLDAFFILNFFEHLPDPNTTLRALHKNLSEDGIGVVEVPNFNMILKNNLFSEFVNDHLFYFTKETLKTVLEINGFDVVECEEVWYNYIITAIVRKRKRIDISHFKEQQKKITQEIKKYISNFDFQDVAVYGAGHQALAILSMANIKENIKYVIDDATFKQNKYTPATHIPIVSCEMIKEKPVSAIIIMAASYSDEIAKKIQKQIQNEVYKPLKISILRDYGLEKIR